MRRGSVYWVNLGESHPPEFGKTRPGVVISNTVHNTVLDSLVIVPLSTKPGEIWPLRIELEGIVDHPSYAVLPGMRQVSKSRLGELVSVVPDETMARIDRALTAYLGD